MGWGVSLGVVVDLKNVEESALSDVLSGKRPISAPTLLRVERMLRGFRSPAAELRIEGVSEPCEFSHTVAVAAVSAQRDSTAPPRLRPTAVPAARAGARSRAGAAPFRDHDVCSHRDHVKVRSATRAAPSISTRTSIEPPRPADGASDRRSRPIPCQS